MRNVYVKMLYVFTMLLYAGQGLAKEPLQSLTIQLNWIPNVQFAGILLAKERGWYRDAGIDLTVRSWEEGISPTDELVSGKVQMAMSEGVEFIRARSGGSAIKAISADFQRSPFCLMSKQEERLDHPKKLSGKKVGIDSMESKLMIEIVLSSQGLKFEEITPVQVGWDLAPFISGKIDLYPAFMNDQPLLMKELGHKVVYIPALEYGYDFYSGVCSATETMIRENPELVENFLRVTLRGWDESFRDSAGTAKLIVEKYYHEGSVKQQAESLKIFKFLARLGQGKKFLGWMEEKYWAKGINILHKFKQIEKKIPAKDVFTSAFLKNIYFGKKE